MKTVESSDNREGKSIEFTAFLNLSHKYYKEGPIPMRRDKT